MKPLSINCIIPSRLELNEYFDLKIKLQGNIRKVFCATGKRNPHLNSPFNYSQARKLQYIDNVLPEWKGKLLVEAGDDLEGTKELIFDNKAQGVYPYDRRAIKSFSGFRWKKSGFKFIKLIDPESGIIGMSNAVYVSGQQAKKRIYWGDPHWQTFFTDGLRSPEELYAFARDEAFLDFGAISDHMESVSDRQWDYFRMVTNDYNQPQRFVTLIGQEWTNHKEGHRNIYIRGSSAPAIRCNAPESSTLEGLWHCLDKISASGEQVIAIPHHSANKIMGNDWSRGWNPKYEKAVEIYSGWGSSECPVSVGNSRPIRHCGGEMEGKHVIDALNAGFKMGFIGGGDIHDGRPGDCLSHCQPSYNDELYPQGLTAVYATELTREGVFDAISGHQTYAATCRRIYLEAEIERRKIHIRTASEDGLRKVTVVRNGKEFATFKLGCEAHIFEENVASLELCGSDYLYVRVETKNGDMAWSSPIWT